jgi:hypothetical protein
LVKKVLLVIGPKMMKRFKHWFGNEEQCPERRNSEELVHTFNGLAIEVNH